MTIPRTLWSLLVWAATVALSGAAWTQEIAPAALEFDRAAMQKEMLRLERICNDLGLAAEARQTRRWLAQERGDQRAFYLPIELVSEDSSDSRRASWAQHFNRARRKFAQYLFHRARSLSAEGNEQEAFLTLWHVLREDPSQVDAKRILGRLATATTSQPRVRRINVRHAEFGWPAKSYSRIETPNFQLTTRAGKKESVELARQLETFYALWQQVFYPLWARPGFIEKKLSGSYTPWKPSRDEIEVVLLRDREDYLDFLGVAEKNIGVSVGYYRPQARKSFFYPAPNSSATLFHELTHQLLAEATHIGAQVDVGSDRDFWLVEGIALYMESLANRGNYWTLGGVESPRLQTARYRAVRDGFWPAWSEFTAGSMDSWKQDPNIARLYTHAAGLTHVFLDGLDGQPGSREAWMRSLTSVYQGRGDFGELWKRLGGDDRAAQRHYQAWMTLADSDIQALSATGRRVSDLVLAGSQLSNESWQSLAQQTGLTWLDVSFSNARSEDLRWISELKSLRRLSVEGTRVDGKLLPHVAQLPNLAELDLSGCAIDDQALRQLSGNRSIRTLWLTGTQVTEDCLETLASCPNLQFCDIAETAIEPESWEAFLRSHPHLARAP